MITLEYISTKEQHDTEQCRQISALIKKTAEQQKSKKLGNPSEAMNILLQKYSVPILAENFPEVKRPSSIVFTPFIKTYLYNSSAELDKSAGLESLTEFPRFAQVLLEDEYLSQLSLTIDGVHKSAALPLIPQSVQALIDRAKALVPSMKLLLLFMPQWEKTPNPDPIILGAADGRYFEIAKWGGDADVLSEFMEAAQ